MTGREVATRVFESLMAAMATSSTNEFRVADSAVSIARQICKSFPESKPKEQNSAD